MLDPSERSVLFEAMRPPPEHELDAAIGTTFTLDLLTLLATPLAFTSHGFLEDETSTDAIELLESVRRFVDRVTVFCQAGYIRAPRARQTLLGFLHQAVVEVNAPSRAGIFHPKLWALRFAGPDGTVHYRLLVLSRNHTFDQSWDTICVLDGELTGRKRAFADNHPLGDFVQALPELALHPVADRVRDQVDRVQHELRRVRWELPRGVESIRFWPMGIDGYRKLPFAEADRITQMAVCSPFLTDGAVARLQDLAPMAALVSRAESLAELSPERLAGSDELLFLPRDIVEDDEDEALATAGPGEPPPRGLHAKTYVGDDGWNARLWVGSANATDAAFDHNVEFMLELHGKKSRLGVDALLDGDKKDARSLRDLLDVFHPDAPGVELDPERRAAERHADALRRRLAELFAHGQVTDADDEHHHLSVHLAGPLPELGADIRAWPVTLGEAHAAPLATADTEVRFKLSRDALTPFLAVELDLPTSSLEPVRFVLNIPLEGLPADYRDVLLRSALGNRDHVLRYLMFLLAEGGMDLFEIQRKRRALDANGADHGAGVSIPLAEELIRALDRAPERLDQVFRLVRDLEATPEGRALLPEGFSSLWPAIWEARQRLR